MSSPITISTTIRAPISTVWDCFTQSEHITHWAFADPSWHVPTATNNLTVGGTFTTRMEAKDGSAGFDFSGTYTQVKLHELIEYTMDDNRTVSTKFDQKDNQVTITQTFDPEPTHSLDQQRTGWQQILDNFKTYAESQTH